MSYMGKLLSVWRMISDCPNQPDLPRQLKTHIFQCFLYLIQIFSKVQNDEENEGAEAASGSSWWGMDYSSMLNKAVSSVSIATTAAALNAAELAKQKVRNINSMNYVKNIELKAG